MFILGRQSALYLQDTRLLRARFGSSSKWSPAPISCPATEKLVYEIDSFKIRTFWIIYEMEHSDPESMDDRK